MPAGGRADVRRGSSTVSRRRPRPNLSRTNRAGSAAPFNVPGPTGREWLAVKCVKPFRDLQAKGAGIMVGEFGAYNKTPHPVVLRWMNDSLANWKDAGWGWALWNFRGSFGVFDSGRDDVAYEDFHGHQLDRKMLELLQAN